MKTTLNITPGPWRIGDAGHTIFRPDRPSAIATICKQDEWKANSALIAEAGTVAHEMGLTPRQLAEQRKELLAALKGVDERLTAAIQTGDTTRIIRARDVARAAIAKATGSTDA